MSNNMKSRVITLDEMGTFENRTTGVRFVGGFVGDVDYDEEKTNIETCLKEVCNMDEIKKILDEAGIDTTKYGVHYPESLHGSDSVILEKKVKTKTTNIMGNIVNISTDEDEHWVKPTNNICKGDTEEEKIEKKKEIEKKIKNIIQEKTIEYLKGNGYRYYMYLDPHVGEGPEVYDDSKGTANILDETQGAVRYERMAVQALYHQLFYTMENEPSEYVFELATRTIPFNANNMNELEKYEGLYNIEYRRDRNNNRTIPVVSITNTSSYKTAIATKLYEQGIDSRAAYKFNVESINYNVADRNTTPYTYMTDILCGYLRWNIQRKFRLNADTNRNLVTSKGLTELFDSFNENEMLLDLHVYSKADAIYRKMVDCVKCHDLVKYYDLMYELMRLMPRDDVERNYSTFYLNTWVKLLDERIKLELSSDTDYRKVFISMTEDYLVAVEGYMGKREINYEKGTFIAERLRMCYEDMNTAAIKLQYILDRRGYALFKLYDIIMRGNNHRGAVEIVAQCIEKCNEYKAYVSIEEYATHILRRVVFYYNMCDFKSALEISLVLKKIGVQLEDIYRCIHDGFDEVHEGKVSVSSSKTALVGKIFSNLGQAYAFLGDFDKSSIAFADAFERFAEDSGDYKITLSYYLHLLIEHGKQSEYELYAKNYFGADTLDEQFDNVIALNNSFALFVFVKAFKRFYMNDAHNVKLFDKMVDYVNDIHRAKKNINHPWELIYKQLCEIAWNMSKLFEESNEELAENYSRLAKLVYSNACMNCIKEADTTIVLIMLNARLHFEDMFGTVIYDSEGVRIVEFRDKTNEHRRSEYVACEEVLKLSDFETYRAETRDDGKAVKVVAYDELKSKIEEKMTYMYH